MEYEFIKHIAGTSLKTFVVKINWRELHFHNDMELFLVLDGSVNIDDGKQRHTLKKDDIFLSNKNAVHSLRRTHEDNLLMVIQFDPNLCKEYYARIAHVRFSKNHITRENDAQYWRMIRQSMEKIVDCYSKRADGYAIEMMSVLNHMLFCMLQYDNYTVMDEKTAAAENRNMDRLRRVIEFMRENYMYPVTLKQIAQSENLDMCYLSHFIKTHLGISFQNYLNRMRVEKAEYLLLHTDLSHIDICMECGFSDYKYLNKTFMKEFLCSPSEYRKKYRTHSMCVEEQSEQHIVMEVSRAQDFFAASDTQSCP
ncbi:MAG: AraC family transcriptional regulator [Christensenella sp.]